MALALAPIDCWLTAHHAFAGKCKDATTVPEVVQDLWYRFGVQPIVIVMDRGVIGSAGRAVPEDAGRVYSVSLSWWQDRAVEKMSAESRRTRLEARAAMPDPA